MPSQSKKWIRWVRLYNTYELVFDLSFLRWIGCVTLPDALKIDWKFKCKNILNFFFFNLFTVMKKTISAFNWLSHSIKCFFFCIAMSLMFGWHHYLNSSSWIGLCHIANNLRFLISQCETHTLIVKQSRV